MKRSLITSSLAALSVAFLLPMGAHAATTTNATAAKHTTVAKSATAARSATASKTESATPAKNATATRSHHRTVARNASATKAKPTKIDINTATREELMTLPGIDGDMADKIIAGRPYKNMAQLKTKGGVTNAEYRKINRKVTARQSAMHSEAPANGTQSESAAQNASGGEGAAGTSGSSDQTTK